jgi:hypothetical protein
MTRQRDIPSIQYRSSNQVNLTLPVANNVDRYEIRGASRVNDAYGAVSGVPGFGAVPMFQVRNGETFRSPSIRSRKLPAVEETNRRLTRAVYDPDDFATPVNPAASYLPPDENVSFIRVAAFDPTAGAFLPEGPIVVVPTPDFFSTKEPVLTFTAVAPNLNIGAFPPNLPDVLPPSVMNLLFPAYSVTVNIRNLDTLLPLFVSFHPGQPPVVVPPNEHLSLTGSGVPEFFFACPNGNPWFTVAVAVVNGA